MKRSIIFGKTNLSSIIFITGMMIIIVTVLMTNIVEAKPTSGLISRQKRVSDQRVAELETLLALSRLRGKLVTVPIGFGRVDPARIGRRRRSSMENGLNKLQRILQAVIVARDSESVSNEHQDEKQHQQQQQQQDDESEPFSSSWSDFEDGRALEFDDQSI